MPSYCQRAAHTVSAFVNNKRKMRYFFFKDQWNNIVQFNEMMMSLIKRILVLGIELQFIINIYGVNLLNAAGLQ